MANFKYDKKKSAKNTKDNTNMTKKSGMKGLKSGDERKDSSDPSSKLVSSIMNSNVVTSNSSSTILEISRKMSQNSIGCVVIIKDGTKEPIGIITETDIIRKVVSAGKDASTVKGRDIMSSPVLNIDSETTLTIAAELMKKHCVRRLPIVNSSRENELVGIITQTDVVRGMIRLTKHLRSKIVEKDINLENYLMEIEELRTMY